MYINKILQLYYLYIEKSSSFFYYTADTYVLSSEKNLRAQYLIVCSQHPLVGEMKQTKREREKLKKNSQYLLIHSFTSKYYFFQPYYMESTELGAAQDLDKKVRASEGKQKDM